MSTEPQPDSRDPQSSSSGASGGGDVVADRRAKLAKLREEMKVDPFGRRVDGLISLADAAAKYDGAADDAHKVNPAEDRRPVVKVAGRIMLHRVMGNLIFITLRDATGDLQIAVSKKAVEAQAFAVAKLVDLGDIVVAKGPLAKTKTGEITVWAGGENGFELATKSLAAPPSKYQGLQDAELRYRNRYVDLWANPHVMKTMMQRTRIVEEIRQYLRGRGFVEVETPMMQTLAGGAAARPFTTHHNALDIDLFMRIAPELYLKRLLVGGFSKVFEVNRNFRNEGISPRHNPEFTMLEAYEAFGSWETMADLVEEMITTVAQNVLGTLVIEHKNAEGAVTKTIDLRGDESKPRGQRWRRVSMVNLVEERTGWRFDQRSIELGCPELLNQIITSRTWHWLEQRQNEVSNLVHFNQEMRKTFVNALEFAEEAIQHGDHGTADLNIRIVKAYIDVQNKSQHLFAIPEFKEKYEELRRAFVSLSPAEQLQEVYEKRIESKLINPTFVTHVPSVIIPLARENQTDPFFADVYELAINGQEISPGYSELNDPDVQERHFRHQVGDKDEQQKVDEDFLNALRVGMPPAGGMGLGIDRLVMMLTGAESIRDVILFPLMRPTEK